MRRARGSFFVYAEEALGRWAGFLLGWLYWFMLVMVLGVEVTGVARIVTGWAPGVPQWAVALVVVIALLSAFNANVYGTSRMMFSLAGRGDGPRVLARLFLGSGVGIATAGPAVLVSYTIAGILVTLIMRMLAEMASALPASGSFSVYAEEALGRWAGFWFMLVMVLGVEVTGVARIVTGWAPGVPQWAVALVVVIALLSAFNANVYGTSRMMFSLAGRGDGPRVLARLSRREVPWVAVLVSVACGVVAVVLNWRLPDALLGILLNAVGSALLVVWVLIVVAQLRLRPRLEAAARASGEPMTLRMWGHPWLSWVTLVALGGLVALMFADVDARAQVAATAGLVLVILAVYGVTVLVRRRVSPSRECPTRSIRSNGSTSTKERA